MVYLINNYNCLEMTLFQRLARTKLMGIACFHLVGGPRCFYGVRPWPRGDDKVESRPVSCSLIRVILMTFIVYFNVY